MKKQITSAAAAAGLILSLAGSFGASAAGASPQVTAPSTGLTDEEGAKVSAYLDEHPGDLRGVEALVESFGGEPLKVQTNGQDEIVTGAES
ncbi:hypothetical protein GCM10027591_05510 [Zhihengliuella somnathii]